MTYSDDVIRLNPELARMAEPKPASKYHNAKTESKGLSFQSGHEAAEIGKLIVLDEKHLIFGLRLQVRFPLNTKGDAVDYIADAVYNELVDGKLVVRVVDAKGMRTATYKIKARLFKSQYGQSIMEM